MISSSDGQSFTSKQYGAVLCEDRFNRWPFSFKHDNYTTACLFPYSWRGDAASNERPGPFKKSLQLAVKGVPNNVENLHRDGLVVVHSTEEILVKQESEFAQQQTSSSLGE